MDPKIIETARSTNRILQVGSQRVSSVIYAKAKELLASGIIGKLNMVSAYWDRNSSIGAWDYSDSAGCLHDDLRLAALSRLRAEDSLECRTLLPVAQMEGLRIGCGRRSLRASLQRHALHHRIARSHARHGHRRHSLLERRPRCRRCLARALRLSGRLQSQPARELRRWRRGERRLPLHRL